MKSLKIKQSALKLKIASRTVAWALFIRMLLESDEEGYGILQLTSDKYDIVPDLELISEVSTLSYHIEDKSVMYCIQNPISAVQVIGYKIPEKDNTAVVEIIGYLNQKTGRAFHAETEVYQKIINARLKEKHNGKPINVKAFFCVIDWKVKHWKGTDQEIYLRPETLFNREKFHKYLDEYVLDFNKTKAK